MPAAIVHRVPVTVLAFRGRWSWAKLADVNQGNATQDQDLDAASGFDEQRAGVGAEPTSLVVPALTTLDGVPLSEVLHAEQSATVNLEARVRTANLHYLQRVNDALSLPMQVLIEQRDMAYRELSELEAKMLAEQEKQAADHERFVSFLMEEQLANLRHVRDQLDATKLELQRTKALAAAPFTALAVPQVPGTPEAPSGEGEAGLDGVASLRQELEQAFAEVDETRRQAVRLQEERDEAIRATDEVRVELQGDIDAARDETFEVQTRLDATLRQLDDARDEARDEAMRLTEEIDDLRRQLDERTEEVRRLRGRLEDSVDEVKHSRPPPPGAGTELDAARREVKWLRQQLIETKRKMARAPTPDAQRPKSPWKSPLRGNDGAGGLATGGGAGGGADGSMGGALQAPKLPDDGG